MKYSITIMTTLVLLLMSCDTTDSNSASVRETTSITGQGPDGDLINGAEASLLRTEDNGFYVDLTMSLPEPGSYNYPEGTETGSPEVFTLWIFVSDDPDAEGFDAAYLGSAHVAEEDGPIRLNGHITIQTEPYTGDGQLEDPMGAKIWLRIAPHGTLNAEKLPGQLTTPSGSAEHWWFADFES